MAIVDDHPFFYPYVCPIVVHVCNILLCILLVYYWFSPSPLPTVQYKVATITTR